WFMEFVEELKPKLVLIENVAELASAHNGYVRDQILERLDVLGYETRWGRLLAADYGVPQMRRRVFFMASRIGGRDFDLPVATHRARAVPPTLLDEPEYVTVRDAIADLPRLDHGTGSEPMPYATDPTSDYQRLVRNGNAHVYDHIARELAPMQLAR